MIRSVLTSGERMPSAMTSLRLMFVLGTRPEAIKLAPLILKIREYAPETEGIVVTTGQHREMLDDVLSAFGIQPDMDLGVMTAGHSLHQLTASIFGKLEEAFGRHDPDVVVVSGVNRL